MPIKKENGGGLLIIIGEKNHLPSMANKLNR